MEEARTDALIDRSAGELAALVRDAEASAREVVQAHLDRIEAVNPHLNAIVTLRAEEALEEADRVQARVRGGEHLPLAGVPFTVKDLIATAGVRTTAGTSLLKDWVPTADASAVGRLRRAGAILLGKTNCPEWGMFPYTRNGLFGETRNPAGPVTPGGSSGGEAAAIAARCSVLGVGTDFGGSLRWPAHCNGTLALRPTAGRVPGTGQLPAPSLVEPIVQNEVTLQGRVQVVGPLARSVEDLGLALGLMSGPDGWDPLTVPVTAGVEDGPGPGHVAVWTGPTWPALAPDVVDAIERAGESLRTRGIEAADERPEMLERAVTLYSELRDTDYLQDVRRLLRGHEQEAGEDVRAAIAVAREAERREPNPDRAVLWEERDRLRASLLSYLDRHTVLLMAVATVPPYALDGPAPRVHGREQSMWDVAAPSRLISLFGLPAASVPFGRSFDGLPIGVQVVGRPFREDEVLSTARMLMQDRGAAPSARPMQEEPR